MRYKDQGLRFGLRTIIGIVVAGVAAFACTNLVSLLISGGFVWDTEGWREMVVSVVAFVTYLGFLALFLMYEVRRQNSKGK